MSNKKYVSVFMALATLATLAVAVPALAQTNANGTTPPAWGINGGKDMMNRGNFKPGVFGTVTAVSGNIITVTGMKGFGATTTTTVTYTVDATSAKITKNNVAGTISSIVVGDKIMAQGTLTGTNLVATTIRDGVMSRGTKTGTVTAPANKTPPITGNGQPVVAGTVSAISGSTLTITNKSNVTYTVDATNAKIVQGQTTITVSGVTVGDSVVVQGTVNGSSVTASSVIDQKPATATTGGTTTQTHKGFFGSIGSFFSHLFGF